MIMCMNCFLFRWLVPAAAIIFCSIGQGSDSPDLPPETKLCLTLDAADTVIVSPPTDSYQMAANRLARGIESSTTRRPRIVMDTVSPGELGTGPIIVLGNLMDSKVARLLYLQDYDFTDYAWPSPGGFCVRTIRDPFGIGAHVIMLGGSDIQGVIEAANELISIVNQNGASLGYLNRVKLGSWADNIKSNTQGFLGDDQSVWLRSGMSGSWEYMKQIAQSGIGYLRTGNEAFLPVFKRELRWWFDHDVYHPKDDAPQMLHGFVHQLIVVWDLIRDHPYFTPQERRRFDEDFLFVFRSKEGPRRIEHANRRTVVRDNHGTRTALDAFFGGRFFLRRFNLPEAKYWLEIAEQYFSPQLASAFRGRPESRAPATCFRQRSGTGRPSPQPQASSRTELASLA